MSFFSETPDFPRSPVVLVIGGMNMDILACAAKPLQAGDSVPGVVSYTPGGVGRNVAENLVRLGAIVGMVSAVGFDAWGTHLLDHARGLGMDVSCVYRHSGQRTATYVCTVDAQGEVLAAVNDMAVLDSLDRSMAIGALNDLPAGASLVLDCNLSQGLLHALVQHLAEVGRSDVRVFVDGVSVHKCHRIQGVLDKVHTLKLNAMEAQALTGLVVGSVAQAQLAVSALRAAGVQRPVITLGADGVVWGERDVVHTEPALPVQVKNATGAGDALLAGLVRADALGWDSDRAVHYGMACAAIALECVQANSVDMEHAQVMQRMRLGNELT